MKKKICKYFALFMLTAFNADAQTAGFHYRAPIDVVTADGFYNIVLTPQINAHLKTGYSDLRIVNDSGKWVPHLLRYLNGEYKDGNGYSDLKIVKIESNPVATDIIAAGIDAPLVSMAVFLKNTEAERYCTLSGSDDQQKWFVINDSIFIKPGRKKEEYNGSDFILEFPPSKYSYYKIHIANNGKDPYNILSVSGLEPERIKPATPYYQSPIENPSPAITQKDSAGISFIKVEQGAAYHFETIVLKLSGIKYFNRNAELYIPSSSSHSFSNPGQLVRSFTVSNNSNLQFPLPVSNAKTFYILIHNDDNLSLKAEEVKTYCNYRVATVYLEKTKQYQLLLDNAVAVSANYDLALKDIPAKDSLPLATIGNIAAIPEPAAATIAKDNSQQLIWLVIGLAALVLGFFTYRLVTDMNKSKS